MGKIIDVEIRKLVDQVDIRSLLDQDHLIYLWGLVEGGLELPPIKITKDFVIIDGRHRVEVYRRYAQIPFIKAEIIDKSGTIEIVKEALTSNMGGALPPNKNDLYRTMLILINKGYSRQRITSEFKEILPPRLLRSCYQHATWKINNKKVNEAIDLVTRSGLTVSKAASLVGISEDSINKKINGKKDHHDNGIAKRELMTMFTHFNKGLGKKFSEILQKYEDGEATKSETEDIVNSLSKLITNQNRMYSEWNKRWNYKK
jgi:hypothetical protein